MKKILFHIFALSVAALTFASCAKELESPELAPKSQIETRTVSFVAESIETKTVFGDKNGSKYPTYWNSNDQQVSVSVNFKGNTSADIVLDQASQVSTDDLYARAGFEAALADDQSGEYTFYAISPAGALYGQMVSSGDYKNWSVEVPASQTPLLGSVDPTAQILVAKSETFTSWPESVPMSFSHQIGRAHV